MLNEEAGREILSSGELTALPDLARVRVKWPELEFHHDGSLAKTNEGGRYLFEYGPVDGRVEIFAGARLWVLKKVGVPVGR